MAINYFARTTFRNERKKFGIKVDDRRRHVYAIGKTGMGKSVMLENMAIQDIRNGNGVCFIDPHGDVAQNLLEFVPKERIKDVVYINPADVSHPIAFNIMEKVDADHRHLVASGLMDVFKKIWPDVWSARMEYILNNCLLALLEYPGATLLDVNRMMADPKYREKVVEKITDPVVKSFWVKEFARYSERFEVEATAAIQNKIGQLISNPLVRNIIGQTHSSLDMRKLMDKKKILIINLAKGRVGEDNSKLLGTLLATQIQLAAMSRVDQKEEERKDFYFYVDEFQNFATRTFVGILSEARKYRLNLILAHQYIEQMEEDVRDAVFGNIGTLIAFRVGAADAEFLEKEFEPEFYATDLVNLGKYNIYLRLMIDGVATRPFSAETLPPIERPEETYSEKIIEHSEKTYGTPREKVEKKISEWAGEVVQEDQRDLHDAVCSRCGKKTKVPFEPDGVRPVYCKDCLKEVREEDNEDENGKKKKKKKGKKKDERKSISLHKALRDQDPIPFSPSKKKKKKDKDGKKKVDLKDLKNTLKNILNKEDNNEQKD